MFRKEAIMVAKYEFAAIFEKKKKTRFPVFKPINKVGVAAIILLDLGPGNHQSGSCRD